MTQLLRYIIILIILLINSNLSSAMQMTIQGYVKEEQTDKIFYRHKITVYDLYDIYPKQIAYTDINGFYKITYQINDADYNTIRVQTHGLCNNYWKSYNKEIQTPDLMQNIDFYICHSYVGMEQIFRINVTLKDEITNSLLANHDIFIYEGDTVYNFKTDPNGYFSTTFYLPPLYVNDFIIKTSGYCEEKWNNYYDTVTNYYGTYNKNFIICHDIFWYLTEVNISGHVFDNETLMPVEKHYVYFLKNNDYKNMFRTATNQNGVYNINIPINLLENNVVEVNTYSVCQDLIQNYSNYINIERTSYQKDFYICPLKDEIDKCHSFFIYSKNDNALEITLNEIAIKDINSRTWSLGDQSMEYSPTVTHKYQSADTYKVCLTNTNTDNCISTFCQDIEIGNKYTISGKCFASENLLPHGKIFLYKYFNNNYIFKQQTEIISGQYTFENVFEGNYIIYGSPIFDLQHIYFPKYLPTYNSGSINFANNTELYVTSNMENVNINLYKYSTLYYGQTKICGQIFYSSSNETEKEGMNILLYNQENQAIDFTRTDSENKYCFENLPYGKYKIYPEYAGKITSYTTINATIQEHIFEEINFEVKSSTITYLKTANKNTDNDSIPTIFPNPFVDELTITLTKDQINTEIKNINIEIYNLSGQLLFLQKINITNETQPHQYKLRLSELSAGIYYLIIKNQTEILIITKIVKLI